MKPHAFLACAAAVIALAGCKKKPEEVAPEAPPETGHQTTEDRQKADLQAFFDGMLVPAQGKKWQDDPLWPLRPEDKFSDWILQTSARAGVTTREQLWAVMKVPVDQLTPDQAQVLFWIHDAPTLDAYWSKALAADPNDLDAVAKDTPVIATHISGHLAAVNSKALEILKFTRDTPNPAGGLIHREADGNPSGLLEETAFHLVAGRMPEFDAAQPNGCSCS